MDGRQDVCLFSRKRMELTGIEEVGSFTEEQIILSGIMGMIAIEGRGLKIENFSMEKKELSLCGEIDSFYYYEKKNSGDKKGFFSKLLK